MDYQTDVLVHMYLDEDKDVYTQSYIVDGQSFKQIFSNKGCYTIHLDHFTQLDVPGIRYQYLSRKRIASKIISYIDVPKQGQLYTICRQKPYLFDDLQEENGIHLYASAKRIYSMTLVFLNTKNEVVLKDIQYGLKFLFEHWYCGKENYTGNWWNYEIGFPKCVNEILVLLYDVLDIKEILHYLNIENFYIPDARYIFYRRNYPNVLKEEASYANLADTIYTCLLRAVLQEDMSGILYLLHLTSQTLCITKSGDGFYKDGSFIQHQNIPYTASYGEVLLMSISKILSIFHALNLDISSYFNTIYDYVCQSYDPFLYQKMAIDCVRGRAQSRKTQNAYYSGEIILSALKKLNPLREDQPFKKMIDREEQGLFYRSKVYCFNSMNRFLKRTNDYLIAVSANSAYIANYESINEENLLGYYSSNFVYDLYIRGKNYENYPLHIHPFYRNGSTNNLEIEPPNQLMENEITAGVSFRELGLCCYHQNAKVNGFFTKYFLKHSMVCVGTNITSNEDYVTTIYQFEEGYKKNQKEVLIQNTKIKIIEGNPVIEAFHERRSFYELNHSESKEEQEISGHRILLKNPKSYHYQIYPKDEGEDAYQFQAFPNAHLLTYMNLQFWSVFTDEPLHYGRLSIKGKVCMMYDEEEGIIYLSTGSRQPSTIKIVIENFVCESSDLRFDDDSYICLDEEIHYIRLRRKV